MDDDIDFSRVLNRLTGGFKKKSKNVGHTRKSETLEKTMALQLKISSSDKFYML